MLVRETRPHKQCDENIATQDEHPIVLYYPVSGGDSATKNKWYKYQSNKTNSVDMTIKIKSIEENVIFAIFERTDDNTNYSTSYTIKEVPDTFKGIIPNADALLLLCQTLSLMDIEEINEVLNKECDEMILTDMKSNELKESSKEFDKYWAGEYEAIQSYIEKKYTLNGKKIRDDVFVFMNDYFDHDRTQMEKIFKETVDDKSYRELFHNKFMRNFEEMNINDDMESLFMVRYTFRLLSTIRKGRNKTLIGKQDDQLQFKLDQLFYGFFKIVKYSSKGDVANTRGDASELTNYYYTQYYEQIPKEHAKKFEINHSIKYVCSNCSKESCTVGKTNGIYLFFQYSPDKRYDLDQLFQEHIQKQSSLSKLCDSCNETNDHTLVEEYNEHQDHKILKIEIPRGSCGENFDPRPTEYKNFITIPKILRWSESSYMIRSIVAHIGGGTDDEYVSHFVCYFTHNGKWFESNDDKVIACKEDPLQTENVQKGAHIILYEKVDKEEKLTVDSEGGNDPTLPSLPNWSDRLCAYNTCLQALAFIDSDELQEHFGFMKTCNKFFDKDQRSSLKDPHQSEQSISEKLDAN